MGHPYRRGSKPVGADLHVYIRAGGEWSGSCGVECDEGGCSRRLGDWSLSGNNADDDYNGIFFFSGGSKSDSTWGNYNLRTACIEEAHLLGSL